LIVSLSGVALAAPADVPATAPGPGGFRAWTGAQASGFSLPGDLQVVWEHSNAALGLTQTRYQQFVGGAKVLGGQITVLHRDGQQVAVIGSHFPGLVASSSVQLTPANARARVERELGREGQWGAELMIDPANGRYFYRVENRRFDSRWFYWIDAADGRQLKKYNGIQEGTGTGVKGDTKELDTTLEGGVYVLRSADNRQATYDAEQAQQQRFLPGTLFSDADDLWETPGDASPGHPAAVDAHYYANVTDDFYQATFNRDSLDNEGMQMVSSVHFKRDYNNAFWNGSQVTYGDGDSPDFRAFSGGLDVVAHELTHGVTEFTSGLIYQNESGALNESFSDIIGNTTEFYAAANGRDPAGSPDWLVAEEVDLRADAAPGFRNMSDPQEDGDPDHYSEKFTGTEDEGGVHINSAISNHAYYLLVNGGKNAGCDSTGSDGHTHTADCDVTVTGIGLANAAQIFYMGFTSLPENATISNARFATVAAAESLFEAGSQQVASTNAAWQAVGVGSAPPAPDCTVTVTALPFESDHPYANNFTCTWIWDNGSPNFRFHFDLLQVEEGFDFVDILDADGNVLESITGTHRNGYTSVVVPTSVGMVRLRTDQLLFRRGFRVDAILPP
jgi:Zn-dependent metalloprotease